MFCSAGWHNDRLCPLISGPFGATVGKQGGTEPAEPADPAEALRSVMNGVKAKSTRRRVKLEGTVPGSAKLQGTSVRALQ